MKLIALAYVRLVLADRRAVTAIEYGLIAAFILLVIVVSVRGMGAKLPAIFETVSSEL